MFYITWIALAIAVGLIGQNKKIGFGWSLFWSLILSPLIGLMIVLLSDKPQVHHYKLHQEKGQKAEYKENYKEAISHYQDALYHLENDYKYLKNSDENSRQKLIESLKVKVEKLKEKTS
jgi:hypothetical protein